MALALESAALRSVGAAGATALLAALSKPKGCYKEQQALEFALACGGLRKRPNRPHLPIGYPEAAVLPFSPATAPAFASALAAGVRCGAADALAASDFPSSCPSLELIECYCVGPAAGAGRADRADGLRAAGMVSSLVKCLGARHERAAYTCPSRATWCCRLFVQIAHCAKLC